MGLTCASLLHYGTCCNEFLPWLVLLPCVHSQEQDSQSLLAREEGWEEGWQFLAGNRKTQCTDKQVCKCEAKRAQILYANAPNRCQTCRRMVKRVMRVYTSFHTYLALSLLVLVKQSDQSIKVWSLLLQLLVILLFDGHTTSWRLQRESRHKCRQNTDQSSNSQILLSRKTYLGRPRLVFLLLLLLLSTRCRWLLCLRGGGDWLRLRRLPGFSLASLAFLLLLLLSSGPCTTRSVVIIIIWWRSRRG